MSVESQVDRERVDQLFRRAPTALATVVVNSALLGLLLQRKFDLELVVLWVGALFVVSVVRAVQIVRYRRADEPAPDLWEKRFAVGAILNGIGWGAGGALFVSDDFPLTVILIFVIGGMVAGASSSTAPSMRAYLGFAIPAAIPPIARIASFGDGVHLVMAFTAALFCVAMTILARQGGRALREAATLRFEKGELAEALASTLRQRGRRMRLLLDRAGVAVLVADATTLRVLDASENLASVLGMGADDVLGDTLDALPLHVEEEALGWAERVQSSDARSGDLVLAARTPVARNLEVVLSVRELDEEELALLVLKDVTTRRRLEAQLAHSSMLASLGTLAAGVAHEINNPLTYMLGNLDQVRSWSDGHAPEEIHDLLDDAIDGSRHIESIVRDLVETARPGGTAMGATDVAGVVRRSVRLLDGEIRHRAELDLDLPDDLPGVVADPAQLMQIAVNLLLNAVQSMPIGHTGENRLGVSLRREGDDVVLTVADTGSGMTEEVRERIFEPFFTTKRPGTGTGLGLSMCHSIATGLGGSIDVDSVEGEGTTFRVALPVGSTSQPSPAIDTDVPSARILLIDDDPRVARSIVRLMKDHEVVWASSGAEGLDRMTEPFDLVLCDMMMPELSGPELFEEVAERFPDMLTRIAFVTGGAFSEEAKAFLDRVQPMLLLKPFRRSDVTELLAARQSSSPARVP